MTYNWVDNPTVSGVSVCDTDILNDDIMWLKEHIGERYVVAKSDKSLLPSYWIEYSDGWCEQGGKITSGTHVALVKTYTNTNYVVTTGQHGVNTSTAGTNYNWVTLYAGGVRDKTTSGFEVSGDNSFRASFPIDWKTSGYIS